MNISKEMQVTLIVGAVTAAIPAAGLGGFVCALNYSANARDYYLCTAGMTLGGTALGLTISAAMLVALRSFEARQ